MAVHLHRRDCFKGWKFKLENKTKATIPLQYKRGKIKQTSMLDNLLLILFCWRFCWVSSRSSMFAALWTYSVVLMLKGYSSTYCRSIYMGMLFFFFVFSLCCKCLTFKKHCNRNISVLNQRWRHETRAVFRRGAHSNQGSQFKCHVTSFAFVAPSLSIIMQILMWQVRIVQNKLIQMSLNRARSHWHVSADVLFVVQLAVWQIIS